MEGCRFEDEDGECLLASSVTDLASLRRTLYIHTCLVTAKQLEVCAVCKVTKIIWD